MNDLAVEDKEPTAADKNSERLADVHARALRRFEAMYPRVRDERMRCADDRRFCLLPGGQWTGPEAEHFANRPQFEVNKIHMAIRRIVSEQLNNRVSVTFLPPDDTKNEAVTTTAELCNGLYRASERDSAAEEATDNAFEEAVTGGMGGWRLRAVREREEIAKDERQTIAFEPVPDAALRIFLDDNARRLTKSDAKWGFLLTPMTPEAYEAEFDDDIESWDMGAFNGQVFSWRTEGGDVFVAEYYEVEERRVARQEWTKLDGTKEAYTAADFKADETLLNRLNAIGARETARRMEVQREVHKYILNGCRVLEDCGRIPGRYVPLIVTYGERWVVDGVERFQGHVRPARDAQRLKNLQLSKLGELSAMGTAGKPVVTAEQIQGHEDRWADDSVQNYPYLVLNQIVDPTTQQKLPLQALPYTQATQVPPALAALLQTTEQDISDILGRQEDGEKMLSNISDKTVGMVQQRLDMQRFVYTANYRKALKHCGTVWLSMAREIFVEPLRKVRTVDADGVVRQATLAAPSANVETGAAVVANDLATAADFEVIADVGPSTSSKRAATVRNLLDVLKITQDPETAQVMLSLVMANLEGEGLADVRAYFRKKLLRMGALQPTEAERADLDKERAEVKPSAQDEYLKAEAAKSQANAVGARAGAVLALARADEAKARVAEILANVDDAQLQQVLGLIDRAVDDDNAATQMAAQQQPIPASAQPSPNVRVEGV